MLNNYINKKCICKVIFARFARERDIVRQKLTENALCIIMQAR